VNRGKTVGFSGKKKPEGWRLFIHQPPGDTTKGGFSLAVEGA
jgi:hypothetical protein